MNQLGGLIAWPDGSTRPGRISFSHRIEAIDASIPTSDDYISPGLIDLQVNGSHGIDVMDGSADGLAMMARHLALEGTTAWLPTVITAPPLRIERVHIAIATAIACQKGSGADGDSPQAAILGMHLEGPFISPLRLGAHPRFNLEPRGKALEGVLGLESLRLVTLAPELAGACEAIRRFCARGVVVSIGHSDATFEQAQAAVAAGALMFTHVFNAMRPLHHRDPGVSLVAILPSRAMAAVIADGVHVHPEMLRLVYRTRGASGMVVATDRNALAGIGMTAASTEARGAWIEGGAARIAGGTLAGSIISMLDGVRMMVEKVGASVGEAALMAATNPATLLGLGDRGRLAPGARADLILLSRELKLKAVFIGGRELG